MLALQERIAFSFAIGCATVLYACATSSSLLLTLGLAMGLVWLASSLEYLLARPKVGQYSTNPTKALTGRSNR